MMNSLVQSLFNARNLSEVRLIATLLKYQLRQPVSNYIGPQQVSRRVLELTEVSLTAKIEELEPEWNRLNWHRENTRRALGER